MKNTNFSHFYNVTFFKKEYSPFHMDSHIHQESLHDFITSHLRNSIGNLNSLTTFPMCFTTSYGPTYRGLSFLLFSKSHHPFHGRYLQINPITYHKFKVPFSIVGIRFLSSLGHLQMTLISQTFSTIS